MADEDGVYRFAGRHPGTYTVEHHDRLDDVYSPNVRTLEMAQQVRVRADQDVTADITTASSPKCSSPRPADPRRTAAVRALDAPQRDSRAVTRRPPP